MFDDLIEKPRPKRWKTAVIVGSALVHAGAIAAVALAAMWKIEKLELASAIDITYRVPAPPGASAPPPGSRLAVPRAAVVKVHKVKPPVPVQPAVVKDPEPVTSGAPAATDPGDGDGPGGDGNDPDADLRSTGTCTTGPCLDGSDGEPPDDTDKDDDDVPKKPPIVPPHVAKGLRVGGNDQIHPPETVRIDMMHQGKNMVSATVQLCVGVGGTVDLIRVMKSTGFKDYDATIVREVRDWRYQPYLVDKRPSPMCTVTMFVYRMRK